MAVEKDLYQEEPHGEGENHGRTSTLGLEARAGTKLDGWKLSRGRCVRVPVKVTEGKEMGKRDKSTDTLTGFYESLRGQYQFDLRGGKRGKVKSVKFDPAHSEEGIGEV